MSLSNEEITALAREYAEWVLSVPGAEELPNYLRNEVTGALREDAEEVLTWLSTRYCLVEKDKVREAFWRLTDKFLTDNDAKSFGAASVVLESFFPEIAKEVE